MTYQISDHEAYKIINSEHHDPFSILGMHQVDAEGKPVMVVRAFAPEADGMWVVEDKSGRSGPRRAYSMQKLYPEGFFQAIIKNKAHFFRYKLKMETTQGQEKVVSEYHDPYSFLPIMGDVDLHLFNEGNHYKIYEKMGAHPMIVDGVTGVYFAVWAPNARRVSVIGDFNRWDGRRHPMRILGGSGVWELFIPGLTEGTLYKFEIKTAENHLLVKTDPYAFYCEIRPKTAAIVHNVDGYHWRDQAWVEQREKHRPWEMPMSVYEVHLGSWMRVPEEGGRVLTYRELAPRLVEYVTGLGFTHIELMPVAEHPFDASWGYQVTCYYAVTSRYGSPEDFMYFVDYCHQHGLGVIMDWVPAHFPKDGHSLAQFDGTCLYEHADPRQAEHKDWGTLIFNYGRHEVKNFLLANLLFWLDKYHIDGIRVDAVASMLYLDYSKREGEWVPNRHGGRENLEALDFLKQMNEVGYRYNHGIITVAEESTAWPGVSRPIYQGGLGFGFKWNMGWMHDILTYFSKDPIYRKHHHDNLTFALLYAFHENFILSLSHDEVVHGKRSLLDKMPGDFWQKFANLRLLLGYMYGQPGKKLLFMGAEIGQWSEWNHDASLDWHLLQYEPHAKLNQYMRDLNHLYRQNPALWEVDSHHTGFEWVDFGDWANNVVSFIRRAKDPRDYLVCVYNFSPVPRYNYRVGVPEHRYYQEALNSDSEAYWGSGMGNLGGFCSDPIPWQQRPCSLCLTLPPLSAMYFKPM